MKLERVAARSLIHPDKQLENDMDSARHDAVFAALQVLRLTPHIRQYLVDHDQRALAQADSASNNTRRNAMLNKIGAWMERNNDIAMAVAVFVILGVLAYALITN
jgi:hypothetical protein